MRKPNAGKEYAPLSHPADVLLPYLVRRLGGVLALQPEALADLLHSIDFKRLDALAQMPEEELIRVLREAAEVNNVRYIPIPSELDQLLARAEVKCR